MIRVLLVGNRGNTNFRIARWLRAKGVDVKLLLEKGLEHERSKPEWEDPTYRDNYPSWIGHFNYGIHNSYFPPREVKTILSDYDVMITSGHYVTSLAKLDVPVVVKPNGDDISTMPFACHSYKQEVISYLYRSRIPFVSKIWLSQEDCIWATKLMGVDNKLFNYPMLVDVDKMRATLNTGKLSVKKKEYDKYDYILFNPSRKNIGFHRDYKGNERFAKAARIIIEEYPQYSFRLVLGMHGKDVEEFRELIARLGLTNYSEYIDHLTLPELHSFMNMDNVLLYDQFGELARWNLGGIAREGLANNCTVLTSTQKEGDRFREVYGEGCPIFTAETVSQIVAQTRLIIDHGLHLKNRQESAGEKWIRHNLDWSVKIDGVIGMLRDVVSEYRSMR